MPNFTVKVYDHFASIPEDYVYLDFESSQGNFDTFKRLCSEYDHFEVHHNPSGSIYIVELHPAQTLNGQVSMLIEWMDSQSDK